MPAQFSIIIPCYNEENAIEETVIHLREIIPDDMEYDLVVVNDGSTDRSGEILLSMAETIPSLKVVTHDKNRGYGAALKTGIKMATTEYIAITDADGTYPNERLPELVRLCQDQDMVVGARTGADVTYSKLRAFPKFFLRAWVSWISRYPVPDINSGLRVFRRDVTMRYIRILPDSFSFTTTITLAMLTNYHRVHYEPINYKERIGSSKIKPIRDTLRFIMLILRTGTYFAPMRVFAPFAMLLMFMGIGSFLYDMIQLQNLTDKTVLLFLFSLNMGMFALLADMIDKRTR
ncbi:glycosyltransferase family 2 protein [Kordiimonas sp.]|uniref:glycosyltransferase family 2 protein n=1 Tax=Kordiimonas sp. TaxID=1970157 RepID=UPI003A8D4C7C